ncbi:DNA polymerase subunit gamma-1-like isoform X2 [Limulus polyphemus]|uniref:DNA-directed DNA polymerase n=1 Tax=Limulus polyphemus TaxID=6850 RepID=A0ABM1BKR2_LIMPO|nr:DNA polymerase subunit gamma-1-like isoform X2 [Limulus polyphemus]
MSLYMNVEICNGSEMRNFGKTTSIFTTYWKECKRSHDQFMLLGKLQPSQHHFSTEVFKMVSNEKPDLKQTCSKHQKIVGQQEFNQESISNNIRVNAIGIQMLSEGLHKQIFRKCVTNSDTKNIKNCMEHLKKHGLWGKETTVQPNVNLALPTFYGNNIDEHFQHLGERVSVDYKKLLNDLTNVEIPKMPEEWKFTAGWIRYGANGNVEKVEYPSEPVLVFDVEVCLQEGNFPTLATAVSPQAWYSWCSEQLIKEQFSWDQEVSLNDLIPLETLPGQVEPSDGQSWQPRLVIGHNVGYDRTYIKEQYFLKGTKLRFVDTLSLHMCVSGLTGLQRALSVAYKSNHKQREKQEELMLKGPPPQMWQDISSLNNLVDVYSLYCGGARLDKSARDIFVTGSLNDVRQNFQELVHYCAQDVKATYEILQKLLPLFFERFPHPVTFAGMLEMSTAYLPVNQNWQRYLRNTEDIYHDLQKELKLSLMHLANDACSLLHDQKYKNDPWLWDLDWTTQEMKCKKQVTRKKNTKEQDKKDKGSNDVKPVDTFKPELNHFVCTEDDEDLDEDLRKVFETVNNLYKTQPFLPGYPSWYRDLSVKRKEGSKDDGNEDEWEPGPTLISTQMRTVPKLMRLTWDGYPLHYDTKHGWGYLVPGKPPDADTDNGEEEICKKEDRSEFPLENLLRLCPHLDIKKKEGTVSVVEEAWKNLQNIPENSFEVNEQWKAILGNKKKKTEKAAYNGALGHHGNGPFNDVNIRGCWFFRLPHKDGLHKRVGNPLAKDFLSKVEDGTLRALGGGQADQALRLNKMVSYWKNARDRILSQMVVWMNQSELPSAVTSNSCYDEDFLYGAILPRVIPAGTVTRRAVEPTWLTASNAYTDRVGSELKAMIQAPPGYHFVGADVDSQELWIAAILGDSHFAGLHGCTAFGWMTLQGKKSEGTDMHSKVAASVGVNRDHAKVINYGRIYGAGRSFAERLLMQFNHRLSMKEAKEKARKMYTETKGVRRYLLEDYGGYEVILHSRDDETSPKIWVGGSESHMFNKLEEIAQSQQPQTPVLKCQISRALEPQTVKSNFMTSRINWVVQSSAVDYLHLILVSMRYLFEDFDIDGRFTISIHDEVRYLVKSEDRYRAALALQVSNLLTRSMFAFKLKMDDLPQSVAFFSSVDVDSVLRKEVNMDCRTPSNPHGLEKGYGVPPGESLDIYEIIKQTNGGSLQKTSSC